MKALILAAGLGTRLQQLTAHRPKALVEVNGHPLIEYVLYKLYRSDFKDVVVNVHHFPDQIISYLRHCPHADEMDIKISDERLQLLNTGGGIKRAFPLFLSNTEPSPVLIHNVDILSNADLPLLCRSCGNHDALLLVSKRQTSRYLLFDDNMRLMGWTNVQTGEVRSPYPNLEVDRCQRLAFSGIHVVSPSVREAMESWPDSFGITDFYIKECGRMDFTGFQQPDLHLVDAGKIDVMAQAAQFLNDYPQ